jgi:hypothetical protein
MAAPNIVNVVTITGKTALAAVTTSLTSLVSNGAASGDVYKINSLYISNVDGAAGANIDVVITRSATNYYIAKTVLVEQDVTLVVIDKNSGIYLEEGDDLKVLASATGDLEAVCSYEIITD